MKVVIEVLAAPAMLGETCHAWMALAIMANAAEVTSIRVGEEDVGGEIDGLGLALEAPASAGKLAQVHGGVDGDENIGVFRHRLGRRQRAQERNTENPRATAGRQSRTRW